MVQIFNQVIIPIPINGSSTIDNEIKLAFYIVVHLILIFIWTYKYLKFKKIIRKKEFIWTKNLWKYLFKDDDDFKLFNIPTIIFLVFNGVLLLFLIVIKLSTIL